MLLPPAAACFYLCNKHCFVLLPPCKFALQGFFFHWLMLFKPAERKLSKAQSKIYNLFIILLTMCSNKSASVNLPRLNGWSAPGYQYSYCSWTGAFPVSGLSSCVYGNEPNSYKFQVKHSEPTEADLKPRKVLKNWSSHHDVLRKWFLSKSWHWNVFYTWGRHFSVTWSIMSFGLNCA